MSGADTVVIPPANAGTTGFIKGSTGTENHHNGAGNLDWPERTAERVKDAIGVTHMALAREVMATSHAVEVAVEKTGAANSLATEKTGSAGILATNVAAGATGVQIASTSAAGVLATNVAGQQIQNLLIQQANLASVQAQTLSANAQALAIQFQAATNLAIEKTAAAGVLLATQFAGQAALTAATNTAAIQAQAAECCCELRTAIAADGQKTRDLINGIELSNKEARLVEQNTRIQFLLSKLPTGTVV
jgi:hypothetical protein